MATSVSTEKNTQYELKHRITGAVILMVFAVVVIPLFLSEPGLEANTTNVDGEGLADQKELAFQSRIIPLDINNVNNGAIDGESQVSLGDNDKPALVDITQKPANNVDIPANSETMANSTQIVMTSPSNTGSSTSSNQSTSNNIQLPEEQNLSGWVVRVGTFSKKGNVDTVATLLTNSGFKPKATEVTTSLGKSIRVWLGPYAKKQTADKISARLKSLIGEKGYVTRTNS